ncbi:cysteine hydrolase family protein [Glaciimonas sp. GNP009]
MSDALTINPARSALLVMDFQAPILGLLKDPTPVLTATAATIAAARKAGLPVIYIVVGFRPGHPEVNARNKMFSGIKSAGWLVTDSPGADINAAVKPAVTDVVLLKHRVGAFSTTALQTILKARDIDTLLLCGVSTSGVVLSTTRDAADADYRLFIVEDGCANPEAEVHQLLMQKVFPRQAEVVRSEQVLAALA